MTELMGSTRATEEKRPEEAKINCVLGSLDNEIKELEAIVNVFTKEISSVLKEETTKDAVVGLKAQETGHSEVYYRLSDLVGNVVDIQHLLINAKSRLEI